MYRCFFVHDVIISIVEMSREYYIITNFPLSFLPVEAHFCFSFLQHIHGLHHTLVDGIPIPFANFSMRPRAIEARSNPGPCRGSVYRSPRGVQVRF